MCVTIRPKFRLYIYKTIFFRQGDRYALERDETRPTYSSTAASTTITAARYS